MKRSGVALRMLPLLDITLILLGMLMVVLAQVQLAASAGGAGTEAPSAASPDSIGYRFIFLYYGTAGRERDRCYTVGEDGRPEREITSPAAFRAYVEQAYPDAVPDRTVILLLISDEGFDSTWDEQRKRRMEEEFGLQVKEIYSYRPEGSPP
jgi:hypothetical protein